MKPSTPSRTRRKLALLFLISFLLSCGLTWWLHTPSAHTAGFYLEKTRYRLFSPYYLPDPNGDGRKDVIGLRIDDEKGMEQAKKFMPELLTPGYIPEGWELESLEVTKKMQGNQYARYNYRKQSSQSIVIEEYLKTDKENVRFYQESEKVLSSNADMYYFTDSLTGLHGIVCYKRNIAIHINGIEEKDILFLIADQMESSKEK